MAEPPREEEKWLEQVEGEDQSRSLRGSKVSYRDLSKSCLLKDRCLCFHSALGEDSNGECLCTC